MAGNANSGPKREKAWRDALMVAVKRNTQETHDLLADDSVPMIVLAAAKVALAAADGDKDAYREIGDRLDGKPKQQTEITGGEDADGNAIPASINVNFRRGD